MLEWVQRQHAQKGIVSDDEQAPTSIFAFLFPFLVEF
jgi:hypothetical protein